MVLALNLGLCEVDRRLDTLRSPRRYWEDFTVATRLYLDQAYPHGQVEGYPSDRLRESSRLYRELAVKLAAREPIRSWQFWRTLPDKPFRIHRDELAPGRPFEDQGRAELLALGFRLLGGVSPFLLLWLGTLAAFPTFLWVSWELSEAGHARAAAVFLLLLSFSPFVIDCLSLTHSGVGFHLLSLLVLVACGAYAFLRAQLTTVGLLLRSIAAGTFVAVAVLCRNSSSAVLPGLFLVLALASMRLIPKGEPRATLHRLGLILFLGIAAVAPFGLVKRPEHHAVWITVWEGLGDFDREKGHAWTDTRAREALAEAGIPSDAELSQWVTPEAEAFFKTSVLRDVTSDPLWYSKILVRRVFSTLTQEKIREWAGLSWRERAKRAVPAEGDIEKYFVRTTTVDILGFGKHRIRLPIGLMLLTTFAFGAAGIWSSRRSPRSPSPLKGPLLLVGCLAVAALVVPVSVTTAAMTETQFFGLVYFLAFAFLSEFLSRGPGAQAG